MDKTWFSKLPPPKFDNPVEVAKANEILSRPPNVPRGHTSADILKPVSKEAYLPDPRQLSADFTWYIPALAYCMMGMDRSLFELYSCCMNKDMQVLTYKTPTPVAEFVGVDVSSNPWFHTLQGIETSQSRDFSQFIGAYRFDDSIKQLSWCLTVVPLRIADPFYQGDMRRGVDAVVLLPECITSGRKVAIKKGPGLRLDTMQLAIVAGQ